MADFYISDASPINWRQSGAAKIAQNCQNLLCTFWHEIAYERSKGMDPEIVDLPLPQAKQKMKAEIYRVLGDYEPRAKILSVQVTGEESGDLHFNVGLRI